MRDVIEGLIAAEAEAERIVQSAREEAERLIVEAQKRAQESVTCARAETRAQAEKLIQAAVEEALALKKDRLHNAAATVRKQVQLDISTRAAIVDAVVSAVCARSPKALSSVAERASAATAAQENEH